MWNLYIYSRLFENESSFSSGLFESKWCISHEEGIHLFVEETCEENFFEQEGERGTEERGEELKSSKFCSAQKAQK